MELQDVTDLCEAHDLKVISHNEEKEYALVLRSIPSFVKMERKANPFFPQTKYEQIAPGRIMILLLGEKKHLTSVPKELYMHKSDLEKEWWAFKDE